MTDLDLALALAVVVPGPILPTDIRHPSDARHNMVILVRAFIHGPSPFTIMCILYIYRHGRTDVHSLHPKSHRE
jgi:hypothetical protein